jgi:hypothetical protein
MRGARQHLKRCDLPSSLVLKNKYSNDHKKSSSLNAVESTSPSLPTITKFIIMSPPGCTHIPQKHNPSFLSAKDDESDPTTYPPLSSLSSSEQLSPNLSPYARSSSGDVQPEWSIHAVERKFSTLQESDDQTRSSNLPAFLPPYYLTFPSLPSQPLYTILYPDRILFHALYWTPD